MTQTVWMSPHRPGRAYVRSFDYDEARRLRAEGVAVTAIAVRYGVSVSRIYQVTAPDPEAARQRQLDTHREWRTTTCESCGGPAMRLCAHKPPIDGRTLCATCRGRASRKRFRFSDTGTLLAVRCAATDCANGERWQPPDAFAGSRRSARDLRPNGIRMHCRSCETRNRRDYRERHKIPCIRCGNPCLPASEKGVRGRDTGLCRHCYRARKAAA